MAEINRAQFLRLGVAGVVGTVGAGLLAGPAAAALPVPAPQGDDVGFLSFGAVAETASAGWYLRAAAMAAFDRTDRRRFAQSRAAKRDHIARINTSLGADAIQPGDFVAAFDDDAFATKAGALSLGRRIESLLVSVYLNGAAFPANDATRLMLGRLLALRRPAARVAARPRRRAGRHRAAGPAVARAGGHNPRHARHHPELPRFVKGPRPVLSRPLIRSRRLRVALLVVAAAALAAPAGAQAVTVYGAASLSTAFPVIDKSPTYNFAGSNQLQLQIERGAPADLFASASPAEPRGAVPRGLGRAGRREEIGRRTALDLELQLIGAGDLFVGDLS